MSLTGQQKTNWGGSEQLVTYPLDLIVSIAVRLAALCLSFVLLPRIRDWRIALLSLMLALMATQQGLRLLGVRSEAAGLVVSVLALLVVVFVGKLILEQKSAERNLKELNDNLERHIEERTRELKMANIRLQDALAHVKMLSGLLPVCSSCRRIRDNEGSWVQMELYIRDHSEADFSHGICPECARRLYPDHCKDGE